MPTATKKKPAAKSAKSAARKPAKSVAATDKALGALPEWNLADLYPGIDAPEVKRDLERADAECVAFEETYKGKLATLAAASDAGAKLAEAVRRYEAIDDLLGRLISFASLVYAGNTTDPVRAKFYGDMQERITAASLHMLFFALELNRVDDAALETAMVDPALGHYRPWIEDVRKEKPYQLEDRVEAEVVEALVSAVRDAYPRLSHRYYALKAKWFGKKTLPHWDRNAPLPKVEQRTIGWNEAKDTVLTAYGAFSPRMADVAERFFARNWIDAPARPGKQAGAFAHPTVPSAHPYVLLNYMGKPRDVMTLAHELGHGVHQVLAAPNGALMAPTPLTLAETASVFGEMLTFKKLLAETTNAKQRRAMLAAKVEDMINTVVRQIAFYTFERKVHEGVERDLPHH